MKHFDEHAWQNMVRGIAVGDSWGSPNEFGSIRALTADNPQGPDLPERLRITDDTQMTLYLARALARSWGQDAEAVYQEIRTQFLAYNRDPDNNRAPGVTVTSSLTRLGSTQDWQQATSHTSDGSGTVMRTAATAFLPEDRWVGITALAAAITHGTANGIAAAVLMTAVIRGLLAGQRPDSLVGYALELAHDAKRYGLLDTGEWLGGYPVVLEDGFAELERLLHIAEDHLDELRADPWALDSDPSLLIGGGGWRSHETLVIALLAADMFSGRPWEALRRAVTSDGDSDTIGAVAGALLGALYPNAFLAHWSWLRTRLESRYVGWIEDEADLYPPHIKGVRARFLYWIGSGRISAPRAS